MKNRVERLTPLLMSRKNSLLVQTLGNEWDLGHKCQEARPKLSHKKFIGWCNREA